LACLRALIEGDRNFFAVSDQFQHRELCGLAEIERQRFGRLGQLSMVRRRGALQFRVRHAGAGRDDAAQSKCQKAVFKHK